MQFADLSAIQYEKEMNQRGEVIAVTRCYRITLWVFERVSRFPKNHKYTLGQKAENTMLEILENLIEASYTREKDLLLKRANLLVERMRYLVRLSKDLKLLGLGQYEFAGRELNELGSMIGGWRKGAGRQ